MAKFCKYCGKELKKGETCECLSKMEIKKETKSNKKDDELKKAAETIKTEVTENSKRYANQFFMVCKDIFRKPLDTMKSFIENENFGITMMILILSSLVIGLCTVSFLKGIYSGINSMLSGNLYSGYGSVLEVSYFKMFLCVSSGMFLGYLLLAVIFDLGFEKISRVNISFKKALSAIAISVLEPAFFCILAAFFTVFSYKLAIIIIIYAIILYLINLYQSFLMSGSMEKNHFNHLFAILILLFGFLAVYLLPNLFL